MRLPLSRSALLAATIVLSATVGADARAQGDPGLRTFVLPYIGSAPETGFQYGATVFRVRQPADTATRPSTQQIFASYTVKGQARVFAEMDRWSSGSDWHFIGHLEWKRFPLPFYGFGDRTPQSAEEFYTPEGVLASAVLQRRVRGPLYVVGGYAFQNIRIGGRSTNGMLGAGTVVGAAGGSVGQLQAGAIWDDRDNVFAARSGTFIQGTGSVAGAGSGSDYAFRRIVVDGRHFIPLGRSGVLALQTVSELTGGVAPFDQLSLVGNSDYLRGYTHGRYRDRDLAAVQAEIRAPIWRRLGGVAFAGAGRIAAQPSDLFGSGARTLPSYGIGVRRTLFANSRSAIRVDYARGGSAQSGLYVALNEAF